MRALFVMDPLSTIKVDKDSSYALMLAWQERGGEVLHCGTGDLWLDGDRVKAKASRLVVGPKPKVADIVEVVELDVADVDVLWKRTDPPYDLSYVFATWVLDLAALHTRVVNDPRGVRDINEKLFALRLPGLTPPTLVTRDAARIRSFLADHGGRAVIKPWDGNGGRGIFVMEAGDRNIGSMIETSTQGGRIHAVVQAYIPEIAQGDKRIILVDGEPRAAFVRMPAPHDHRGNISAGATVHPSEITPRDREICDALRPLLVERKQLFVGIDVIGRYLTEVNVTSPTGLQEVRKFTGLDLAAELVDRALGSR